MANPEVDHGFVYTADGLTDIATSSFFDVKLGLDTTVEGCIDRIRYTLVKALEVQSGVLHRSEPEYADLPLPPSYVALQSLYPSNPVFPPLPAAESEKEAYGNTSSNSSDDDEWNEMSASKRLKRMGIKENKKVANDNFASTTQKLQTIFASSAAEKEHSPPEQYSSRSTTARRKSGVSSKKLYEAFHQNQYPTREMKESLAQELCITFQQVSKWFDNARHCFRVNSKESINVRMSTSDKVNVCRETSTSHSNLDKGEMTKLPGASTLCKAIDAIQTTRKANPENKKLEAAFQDNQFPSREKKEELAQQLGRTFDQVSVWFKNARRRHSRTSAKESSNAGTSSSDKAEAHCRTPTSRESGIGVPEQSPGLFTTEEAIITSTPNHVKPDNIIQMSRRDSTLDMVTTPRSCTSLWKLEHDVDLESPGVSVENGASKEKSKKGHVAKNPNTRSEKSKASGGGDIELGDSRQKAIAKELRRRKIGR